jgi:hypothetical protein
MAMTTATMLAAAGLGLGVVSGVQQMQAGKEQAKNARDVANAQAAEAGRVSAREAFETEREAERVTRAQKVAYLASGVSLEGSPLLVMEETRRKGAENAEEILKSGASRGTAALMEGRIRASNATNAGRAAFMGSVSSGLYGVAGTIER